MPQNPYARPESGDTPDPVTSSQVDVAAYGVETDGLGDGNTQYLRSFGWAPSLRIDQTPDGMRTMDFPTRDVRPVSGQASEDHQYYAGMRRDVNRRESVTSLDADGRDEPKNQLRRAPDPRWTATEEPRRTLRLSPSSWMFTRPYAENYTGTARYLNGLHFSMADNRREWEVLGMEPPNRPGGGTRNTYRIDPVPWDSDMFDVPLDASVDAGRIVAVDIPPAQGTRSWRL